MLVFVFLHVWGVVGPQCLDPSCGIPFFPPWKTYPLGSTIRFSYSFLPYSFRGVVHSIRAGDDDSDTVGELPVAEVKVEEPAEPPVAEVKVKEPDDDMMRDALRVRSFLDRRFAETLLEREVEDKLFSVIQAKHGAGDSDDAMDTGSTSSSSHWYYDADTESSDHELVMPPSLCLAGPAPVFVFGNVFIGGNVAAVIVQNTIVGNNYNQVHIGRP